MRSTSLGSPAVLASLLGIGIVACGPNHRLDEVVGHSDSRLQAEVTRTTNGIAHVRAPNFRGLGYGLAYAYAQDNVCMFADTLLTVRGERSRFFGPDAWATPAVGGEYGAAIDYLTVKNQQSDFFFKAYLDIEQLRAGHAAGSTEAQEVLAGYVTGYNRYLKDSAGKLPAACNQAAWVRPITVDDMYLVLAEKALHASGEVFAQEIVNGARDAASAMTPAPLEPAGAANPNFVGERLARLTKEQLGSNAIALGRDLSVNGRGLLLGNPHYPWTSTDRFYQAHLTVPGRYDAMGVVLGGIPIVVIGFNQDIAWSHTVTTAVHFTTFKLALDPTDASRTTYLSDGAKVKMTSRTVSIDVKQADGSIATRSKTFFFTKQGAVMVYPAAGVNWTANEVTVLADPNRTNTRMVEQWIAMGSSKSVTELKAALDKHVGLPWVNTVAADRAGNVLYADASVVPHVTTDTFMGDCFLVPPLLSFDGSRNACAWGGDSGVPAGIFSPINGPSMLRTDYVANSNDSYWLTNARSLLLGPGPLGYSPLYGRTAVEQSLRTRIAFKQLEEKIVQRGRLQVTDLQELAFANRIYAAELVLPDLLPRCHTSLDLVVLAACDVLSAWDRKADVDSRGAVLFREFWNIAYEIENKWAVPFNPADPVNTPRGLSPGSTVAMLGALKQAGQKLQSLGIPLNARLGDYQTDTRNGIRIPVHGGIGDIDGSFNSIHMGTSLTADGYRNIVWGTSYVQTVSFDNNGPVAYAMLTYGQSVDPKSPYYGDQVPLYAQKKFPQLPFTQQEIRADPQFKQTLLTE